MDPQRCIKQDVVRYPEILALGRQRQEAQKFKVTLDYTERKGQSGLHEILFQTKQTNKKQTSM